MQKENRNETTALGFWLYIMSDCVLFAGLFATFAVLRSETFGGPSVADISNLPYVLIETIALLTSSFTVGLALLAAYRGNRKLTLAALGATLVLGFVFLEMEIAECTRIITAGHSWTTSASLSSYFVLLGTHGLHVALASLWMILLMGYIWTRGLTSSNMRKLLSLSLFWHFLDIVWIFIFTFVYLFGNL